MLDVKQMFEEVIDEKLGAPAKDPNHSRNAEFIKRYVDANCKPTTMTSKIHGERKRYLNAINAYDSSLLDGLQNPDLF